MYRWCSFCQTYQGEVQPFDDFSLTHGICTCCQKNNVFESENDITEVVNFFQEMSQSISLSTLPQISEIKERAKKLKIQPSDLFIGLIQPLLYEIGCLYSQNKITVAQEHEFSRLVDRLLYELAPTPLPNNNVDVLIVCADGNHHPFGARFLEMSLLQKGYSAKAFYPSLPTQEIIPLARKLNSKVVAISVTLPNQLDSLKTLVSVPNDLLVIVGGQGVKDGVDNIGPLKVIPKKNFGVFFDLIDSHLSHFKKAA